MRAAKHIPQFSEGIGWGREVEQTQIESGGSFHFHLEYQQQRPMGGGGGGGVGGGGGGDCASNAELTC